MKKEFGIILISVGVILIFLSLFWSYQIFFGIKNPPSVFSIQQTGQGSAKSSLELGLGGVKIDSNLLRQELNNFLPPDILAKILNLFSWAMFAFILIYGGGKVSQIGIRLLA